MTFDEMERAMQFLVAQQAQFAADLQQSRDMGDRRHGQVTEALMGLTAIAGGLMKADERLGQRLEAQSERFDVRMRAQDERFDARMRALDERLAALADAQRDTETRLSSLMRVVEHHVGDRPPPAP